MQHKLSDDQVKAYDQIMAWFKKPDDKHFVLAGYAGTGKTTLAKTIADSIGHENCMFLAFTGKAANVLRDKGCANANTIHSTLYRPKKHKDEKGNVGFKKQPSYEFLTAPLIIVDEYSMLTDEVIRDINTHAQKVLYLGDSFQLPPPKGNQTLLHPHFTLENIHRQALESPILRFATAIRQGENVQHCDWGDFKYVRRNTLGMSDFLETDQFICGNNDTRNRFNKMVREKKEYKSLLPQKGEKIMITKNNKADSVFNGMIDFCSSDASSISSSGYNLSLEENGSLNFLKPQYIFDYSLHKGLNTLEFAYALTCHKSQGSEFDNVIVYNEPPTFSNIEKRRWLYTAATRAKKTLIITDAKKK